MSKEELEKLEREKYVVERKLTAAMHKEKRLQSELKRLTRSERTHRLCTRAGMLETFLKEPTTLTDDDVMELLTFIFHSEAVQKKLDDDIRTKLLNAGVPEQEIEFIHNADTENKKAEVGCGLSEKPHGLRPEPRQDTAGRTGQQLRMQSLDRG